MQPRLHQQTLITVSKKPVFVSEEAHKRQISTAAESPVFSLPCAQMSVKSFRLVRQLPGDQQEAVGAYKHTLVHGLCLDPSCRKHDTSEDAKTNPERVMRALGFAFFSLRLNIIACMTLYVYIPVISVCLFSPDFACSSQKDVGREKLLSRGLL